MLVQDRMTRNPITINPDTSVSDASRIMRERKVRRLPVLDARGRLVGIVSENDLRHASPSPATTLDVWEISALVDKIKVAQIMTRDVITVTGDTPLEEAARLMTDHKISALPVLQESKVIGIITETDLFKSLLELLGGRRPGVRLTVAAAEAKGTLARIAAAISEAGGDIVGLGCEEMQGSGGLQWEMVFKVQDLPKDKLLAAVQPVVTAILDARES
jgi:acetoin utilization protein AcuB